jgi:hypothetical protein
VKILCNDCHEESECKFHIVGLKCGHEGCGSYNTRQVSGGPEVDTNMEAAAEESEEEEAAEESVEGDAEINRLNAAPPEEEDQGQDQ